MWTTAWDGFELMIYGSTDRYVKKKSPVYKMIVSDVLKMTLFKNCGYTR